MRPTGTARALLLAATTVLIGCSSGQDLSQSSSQLDFGVRAARMNLWREARFRFQRAAQIDPSNAMARNNLAVAYEGAGDFDRARLAYLEALKLDQSNQYIQKNYSRFMEFYSRNKRREGTAETKSEPSRSPSPPGKVPDTFQPPPQLPATTGPPEPPVSTPPDTNKPNEEIS